MRVLDRHAVAGPGADAQAALDGVEAAAGDGEAVGGRRHALLCETAHTLLGKLNQDRELAVEHLVHVQLVQDPVEVGEQLGVRVGRAQVADAGRQRKLDGHGVGRLADDAGAPAAVGGDQAPVPQELDRVADGHRAEVELAEDR